MRYPKSPNQKIAQVNTVSFALSLISRWMPTTQRILIDLNSASKKKPKQRYYSNRNVYIKTDEKWAFLANKQSKKDKKKKNVYPGF